MAKLKHWQGYGSVDAKKLTEYPAGNGCMKAIIKVTGNHEYGVVREDPYDVHRWLGKRFFPGCSDSRHIRDLNVIPGTENGVDTAVYEVTYWNY